MSTYFVTDYGVVPNDSALQTEKIQAVLDLCKNGGGAVVIPAGTYRMAGVRMWSDTTIYLQSGANLVGSDECDDYVIIPPPDGMLLRDDVVMFKDYSNGREFPNYRRAMISAYGEKNIAIIGEENTMIDGSDCYDPIGEEDFRGPHGIYITNCENVTLRGYTIGHSGNFMHQADLCKGITMQNVTCLGGHDGIHLHYCVDTLIEDCVMTTGDDCIAGCNIRNLTVRNCELNTSCNFFRIGGVHMLIENCHMYGPGYYPHRMTVVKGKNDELPREGGRHNSLGLMHYFGSRLYQDTEPARDIVFRNCRAENFETLMYWTSGEICQVGEFAECVFENLQISGVRRPSWVKANEAVPLTVYLKNVEVEGGTAADLVNTASTNTKFVIE